MVEIFHSAARHPLCCSRQPAASTVRRGMKSKELLVVANETDFIVCNNPPTIELLTELTKTDYIVCNNHPNKELLTELTKTDYFVCNNQ